MKKISGLFAAVIIAVIIIAIKCALYGKCNNPFLYLIILVLFPLVAACDLLKIKNKVITSLKKIPSTLLQIIGNITKNHKQYNKKIISNIIIGLASMFCQIISIALEKKASEGARGIICIISIVLIYMVIFIFLNEKTVLGFFGYSLSVFIIPHIREIDKVGIIITAYETIVPFVGIILILFGLVTLIDNIFANNSKPEAYNFNYNRELFEYKKIGVAEYRFIEFHEKMHKELGETLYSQDFKHYIARKQNSANLLIKLSESVVLPVEIACVAVFNQLKPIDKGFDKILCPFDMNLTSNMILMLVFCAVILFFTVVEIIDRNKEVNFTKDILEMNPEKNN